MPARTSVDAGAPLVETDAWRADRAHPRVLGWRQATALALGGSNQSLFLIGALLASQGTAAVPLLTVGLVLAWAQVFGWTELVLMWPRRVGGIAAVCAEAFRPYSAILANLTGVCYWWGWVPTCGLTAILSASAIHQWCLPGVPVTALAAALIAVFTAVCLCGVRWAARVALPVAIASAILAFLSVLVPVISGHVDWHRAAAIHLTTPFAGVFGQLTSAMAGLYLVGFAAPAFEAAACHVGEMRDPARTLPRAMFASAGMATLYFAVIPVVWLGVFGSDPLQGDLANILGPAFAPLFGATAKAAAIAFMTLNMFHGTLQPLAGASRTLSQLSEDGLLPRSLARRNRHDVPYVATLLTAGMATLFLLTGDPTWVIAAANLTYLIGVCLPSVAVWLLRRRAPDAERPYRAPRGLVSVGVAAAVVWLLATLLGFEQFGLPTVLAGIALAYSGSLAYAVRQWRDRRASGRPSGARSLQFKLTGAMVLVVVLDGLGYRLAVAHISRIAQPQLVTALEDIFVAVALLTITLGLVLPGVIAHAATQVADAAERLRTGTVRELTEAMRALAAGDLDHAHAHVDAMPVVVTSRDEIGVMADSFNAMQAEIASVAVSLDGARDGLRDAYSQLTAQNEELEQWGGELERRVSDRTAALQRAHDELAALATSDPLTGLPNHRVLVAGIEHELERASRYRRPVSILFIDIDHFKALNDTLGHGAGDSALHEVGAVMGGVVRPADTIGRWGGEEFLVLLPETGTAEALVLAERLRETVAGHGFLEDGHTRLTVSIGAATFPADGENRRSLTEAADRAMYAAKRLGRNRAFAASDPATTTTTAAEPVADEPRDGGGLAGAVEALAALIRLRDADALAHMDEVSSLAVRLAVELDCDELEARLIGVAGQLHDVGKLSVPDAILLSEDPLSEAEWEMLRGHAAAGAEVLARVRALHAAAPYVRGHHERWDGTGYPDQLAGEAIPLGARIVAVADAYAAITTDRVYAAARSSRSAEAEIRRCSGSQFDPAVVAALERVLAPGGDHGAAGRGEGGEAALRAAA